MVASAPSATATNDHATVIGRRCVIPPAIAVAGISGIRDAAAQAERNHKHAKRKQNTRT
jgi:hypothetical protein